MAAETPVLEAVARAGVGKGAARTARREGLVPGVIYGGGQPPVTISLKYNELLKRLQAGRFLSTLFNVNVDGTLHHVVCRGVQRDVVKDKPTHVDFLRLSDNSRINLFIPVEFINREKSPGLKRGGVLNVVRREVEVMADPDNVPEGFEIDLAEAGLGDSLRWSAVKDTFGTKAVLDRDFVVATIAAPTVVEEAPPEPAAPAPAPAPAKGAAKAPAKKK